MIGKWLILAVLASGTATGAVPARPGDVRYVVQKNDTLVAIGKRGFRTPRDYLVAQRYNKLRLDRQMPVGSVLQLPVAILRTEPIGAKIIAFRGTVTVAPPRGSASVARKDMAVVEGTEIRTAANAFVTIELADGSLVTLPSLSRVAVGALHRIVLTGGQVKRFRLLGGRAEAAVEPVDRKGGRFEIATPISVAAVRGTEFRATFDEASASSGTSVVGGAVAVAAGGRDVAVPAGLGVVADATGPAAPVTLLPAPALADPDKLQDEALVSFPITPVPGAARYRAQVATDAGFVDIIAEGEAAEPVVTLAEVPNGTLFARVTALSRDGLEGLPKSYSVERRQNNIIAETGPPATCPATRCLRFRWRAGGEGERRFRFQLAASRGGTPIVDLVELTASEVILTDLPGGTYYWRVESALIDQGKRQAKWLAPQELRVAPAARR